MGLLRAVVASGVAATMACITSPRDDDALCGVEEQVDFTGTGELSEVVTLEASPNPAGPFVAFATATVCDVPFGGTPISTWAVSSVVPVWTRAQNPETYVRAWVPDGQGGQTFLTTFEAGTSPEVADQSPLLRLTAPAPSTCDCPTDFVGDAVIDSGPSARRFACLETLTGDLIVTDDAPINVALPDLVSVSGSVELDFSVGCPLPGADIRTIDLSSLTTVGGNIEAEVVFDSSFSGPTLDVGMDMVTSVGGSISVVGTNSSNASFDGLGGLASLPGSLVVSMLGGDLAGNLLNSLTTVQGDVEIEIGNSVFTVVSNVVTVGGAFTLRRARLSQPGASVWPSLTTVGGDMILDDVRLAPAVQTPRFESLTSVGGTFQSTAAPMFDAGLRSLEDITLLPLSVGGLILTNNTPLTALGASVTVATQGSITITDNANLPTCTAQAFVDGQSQAGWEGVSTIEGNQGNCP